MTSEHEQGLVRHSMLLLAATQIANITNLIFQALMGWTLDRVEYGILAAMLNITLIVATPLDALRTATAHFAGRVARAGQPAALWGFLEQWAGRVAAIAVPLAVASIVFSRPMAAFFQMQTPYPIMLTGIMLVGLVLLPLLTGALQGLQSFLWMSASQYAWSVVRLAAGAVLVFWVSRTSLAGLTAQTIGVNIGLIVGALGLRKVLGRERSPAALSDGVGAYFVRSLLMLGGYAVLMNADMLLVKHYFAPDTAGEFARAATIGRAIIFLTMPIALAMFPKVISMGDTSRASRRTLFLALIMAAGLIACAAVAVTILPWLPLRVMYNVKVPTAEQIHLLRCVIWAMAPLGVAYLLMNFEMAQHRFAAVPFLIVLAVGYVAGVAFWHANVLNVVAVLGVVSVAAAIVFGVLLFRGRSPGPTGPATT